MSDNISVTGCSFAGVKLDADATRVAESIATAATAIARSNETLAGALKSLAERFATANFDSMVRIGDRAVERVAEEPEEDTDHE